MITLHTDPTIAVYFRPDNSLLTLQSNGSLRQYANYVQSHELRVGSNDVWTHGEIYNVDNHILLRYRRLPYAREPRYDDRQPSIRRHLYYNLTHARWSRINLGSHVQPVQLYKGVNGPLIVTPERLHSLGHLFLKSTFHQTLREHIHSNNTMALHLINLGDSLSPLFTIITYSHDLRVIGQITNSYDRTEFKYRNFPGSLTNTTQIDQAGTFLILTTRTAIQKVFLRTHEIKLYHSHVDENYRLTRPAISPDGSLIAVQLYQGPLQILNSSTMQPVRIFNIQAHNASFSPDGLTLAVATDQGAILLDLD